MFWIKCGKIVTDKSGKLINCDECPCPYWGIFVFLNRSYNKNTGQTNYCYQSAEVKLLPVEQGCLAYSNMYQRKIKVSRKPDANGKVGYVKNCVGCYEDCVEWDADWNCIRTQQYCDDCSQITVYRISPCFQTKKQALEYFYADTEVIPDTNGNYPDEQSNQYYNTLENVWRPRANKYKPNTTFTFEDKGWSRSFYGPGVQKCDNHIECYDWETGQIVYEGDDYPDNWIQKWDCWEVNQNCVYYVFSDHTGNYFCSFSNVESEQEWEAIIGTGINALNSYIESQISDINNYNTSYDKRENVLCFNKDYASNYGYYTWDGNHCGSSHKWWGVVKTKLILQQFSADRHPDKAKGVIIDYTRKRTLRNSYEEAIVTQQKFEDVFVPFGGEIDFPLANNLNMFYQCQNYDTFTGFQSDNYKNQRYDISVTVKEYKF